MPEAVSARLSPARWYGLAAAICVADQASKALVLSLLSPHEVIYVLPFWNWVMAWNPGAAFSFLADESGWQRWFFTGLALLVSGWLGYQLRQPGQPTRVLLAFTLVLGGAVGNVIDRLRFGAVLDFIQWHVSGYYWPAFNVADAAITLGALLLIWTQLTVQK